MRRSLGLADAVVIGVGSMVGAGIFVALAPAAKAAGSGLLVGLTIAAVVAYCNATSSARLAARYPTSGGTYVYGRERLGEFWGFLAGWGFVVGKTASCAAMALTVGVYVWPDHARVIGAASVIVLVAVNYRGIGKSAKMTRAIVVLVAVVLAAVVVAILASGAIGSGSVTVGSDATVGGVLQAAGLLFFAFAGYARIATLGEEVRDPRRTIPRAIGIALAVALAVYSVVAVSLLLVLGPDGLASSSAPLLDAVREVGTDWLAPVVVAGAALAALGSLLSLILGVSRTTLAMARDHRLPHVLAAVHPRFGVPHHAEVAVGVAAVILVLTVDVREVIGFSSFGVLVYYAIANASAWTLTRAERRPPLIVPAVGLAGCLVLAATLPASSVLAGAGVLGLGVLVHRIQEGRLRSSR